MNHSEENKMINELRWSVAILFLLAGVWVSLMNWVVFWTLYIKRTRAPSWTPLLGGLLVSMSILLAPLPDIWLWAWIPFVLDWGSAPGIGYTAWFHIRRTWKE